MGTMEAAKTENERKKKYLKSYMEAKRRARYIQEEIQRLKEDKMFPSLVMDGMPHGSGKGDLSRYMEMVEEQNEKLGKELLEMEKLREGIERRIKRMKNGTEREALRLRYIRGMKWEDIADRMGYSWRGIHKVHSRALNHFKID